MQLEFGWKNAASQNILLNKTEKLSFALKSYNINYSQDGQIDLTIDGTAFNERFNNTLIGDENENGKGGLSSQYNKIKKYQEYLQTIKNSPDKSAPRDMGLVKKMFDEYETQLTIARGEIRNNFHKNMNSLQGQSGAQYKERGITLELFKNNGMITLHDLIKTICEGTFVAFEKITQTKKTRFIYGLFNDEIGKAEQSKFPGQPIADFPIDLALLREKIGKYAEKGGSDVLTLEAFFNLLIRDFLHDTGYWQKLESTKESVRLPHMFLAINNYTDKEKNQIMDISLIDINHGIPMTSEIIKGSEKLSVGDFEKKLKDKGVPVIKLGHGNSFIQSMKMSNIMDEYMKAALIKRMFDTSSTLTRAWVPPELQNAIAGGDTRTPLHLPLQGSMTVLGCVDFKPFRSFGLISNFFVIDGIYKIMSVTHTLSAGNFTTEIQIMYH